MYKATVFVSICIYMITGSVDSEGCNVSPAPAMRPLHPKYTHALSDILRHEISVAGDNHVARGIAPGSHGGLVRGGGRYRSCPLCRELLSG